MAYDSARGRTVLFGGQSPTGSPYYSDTWEFDGQTWQQMSVVGGPPQLFTPTMTYDSVRKVMLLYGMATDYSFSGLWEWNGVNWTAVSLTSTNAPSGRGYQGMAYDSARAVHVLFGGLTQGGVEFGDTWEYNGVTRQWSLRSQSGPGSRFGGHLIFDATRNETLLYGGLSLNNSGIGQDTWVWNGGTGTWTQLQPASHPAFTRGYGIAYDPQRQIVLLQCGGNSDGSYGDSWEWNGIDWSDRTSDYSFCCPRYGAGMVYDTRLGQFVLFGGQGARSQDTWMLRPAGLRASVDWRYTVEDPPYSSRTVHGVFDAPGSCFSIIIQSGDYPEGPRTYAKPAQLEAVNGAAVIH